MFCQNCGLKLTECEKKGPCARSRSREREAREKQSDYDINVLIDMAVKKASKAAADEAADRVKEDFQKDFGALQQQVNSQGSEISEVRKELSDVKGDIKQLRSVVEKTTRQFSSSGTSQQGNLRDAKPSKDFLLSLVGPLRKLGFKASCCKRHGNQERNLRTSSPRPSTSTFSSLRRLLRSYLFQTSIGST